LRSRRAGCSGRAGPPLLFGFAPRGVFRALDIAAEAVGSYPTFSPLPNALRPKQACPRFFREPAAEVEAHRRYILCGTFRSRSLSSARAHRKDQPPDVIRRVARGSQTVKPKNLESGLSSRLHCELTATSGCATSANRRSPGPSASPIITRALSRVVDYRASDYRATGAPFPLARGVRADMMARRFCGGPLQRESESLQIQVNRSFAHGKNKNEPS
jgi:hypothetical protein